MSDKPKSRRSSFDTIESELAEKQGRLSRALDWVLENDANVETRHDIKIYYVYLHRHPATNAPFYVGKGVDARAWNMLNRHPDHTAMLYKLLQEGHPPGSWVSLVKWGLTEFEALKLESQLQRDLTKQNVDLINRTRPIAKLIDGRISGGWIMEKKPSPRSLQAAALKDLESCDLTTQEGLRKAIEITLTLLPAETFYLSMWEILSRLKIAHRGRQQMDEGKTRVAAAFAAGIAGWFLDGNMYIRRKYE